MDVFQLAAETIISSRYTIAFTGAGVSAESGIPTFRDKGGLWEKYPVELFGTPQGIFYILTTNPTWLSDFILSSIEVLGKARPNLGHIALGDLEKLGFLKCVITQNIDNLHQEGGNTRVIEVHGSITRMRCIICGEKRKISKEEAISIAKSFAEKIKYVDFKGEITLEYVKELLGDALPTCGCGGILRPDVVLFTEAVHNIDIAMDEARKADCCIVAGTSGVVYPAAYIPQIVKSKNGKIIEINPKIMSFNSDIYINDSFAKAMPKILNEIKKKMN